MPKTPSYRTRPGYTQAIVTLTDSATKRRRDYWLGPAGSRESREKYHRLVAEWEAAGRRLPDIPSADSAQRPASPAAAPSPPGSLQPPPVSGGVHLRDIIVAYWKWAVGHFNSAQLNNIKSALRLLRRFDNSTPAAEYGPRRLLLLREAMIRGDPAGRPPRRPWSRRTTNERVRMIVNMFRWAATRELITPELPAALAMLEPLKRGRTTAREGRKIGPAPSNLIEAAKRGVSRQVAALIDLQLLTAARPGELLRLRAGDIDRSDPSSLWAYRPERHKNAFRGHDRVIYFGPRAQEVLRPFLDDRHADAYLFSPAEAERERRAARSATRVTPIRYGNRPGTNRVRRPARTARDHYTTDSYHRAITRACDEAFPPPQWLQPAVLPDGRLESEGDLMLRLSAGERSELAAWRRAHRFHPHQLRHNAATELRRQFGLEAAQLVLGHSSALVTEAVYAERDQGKVAEVVRRAG